MLVKVDIPVEFCGYDSLVDAAANFEFAANDMLHLNFKVGEVLAGTNLEREIAKVKKLFRCAKVEIENV